MSVSSARLSVSSLTESTDILKTALIIILTDIHNLY